MAEKIIFKAVQGRLKDDEFVFEESGLCLVGRSSDSALRISKEEDMRISRRHCLLILDPPSVRIRDLGSRNGTYINGERLEAGTLGEDPAKLTPVDRVLKHGDEISLGETVFCVEIPSAADSSSAAGGRKTLPPGTKVIKLYKPSSQQGAVKKSKPIDTGFFGTSSLKSVASSTSPMTELISRGALGGEPQTKTQSSVVPPAPPEQSGEPLELKVQPGDKRPPLAKPVPPPLSEALVREPDDASPPAAPVRLEAKKNANVAGEQPAKKPLKARIVRKPSSAKSKSAAKPNFDGTEIMDVDELVDDTALGREYKRAEQSGKRIAKFKVKKPR